MKGANGHIFKAKTIRVAFPSHEEEMRFDNFLTSQGLKKGAFLYRLIKGYLDSQEYNLLSPPKSESTAKADAPYSQGGIRNGHPDQAG